jgi:hypothetical protein
MTIKRFSCFLLAFAVMMSLFAGCAKQGGEVQTGTVPQSTQAPTEPVVAGPPRTAEELVPRLNTLLKEQNIPLEFVYAEERTLYKTGDDGNPEVDRYYSLYLAAFTDSGAPVMTNTFDLSVEYANTISDPILTLQIWIGKDATEREREMHQKVCTIAAQLCDEQMNAETINSLLVAEPKPTQYVADTGAFKTFTFKMNPYNGVDGDYDYSVVYCQNGDMLHTVSRFLFSNEAWYEIEFDQHAEALYAQRIFSAPSVEELEQRINDALAAMDAPITCTMVPYVDYGCWRGVFQWSTLEDPDYAYPEFPYEEFISWGNAPENITDEVVAEYISSFLRWVCLDVDTRDPIREDAPAYDIQLNKFDGMPPELLEALCIACDPENGAGDVEVLHSLPIAESEGRRERVLQKDGYTITHDINEEGLQDAYKIHYEADQQWYTPNPTGEALLDPALMDYEFRVSKPMVVDGMFNYYGDGQGYQTYFHDSQVGWVSLSDMLNDFLDYTRTNFSLDPYWDRNGEHSYICDGFSGAPLNSSVFRIDVSDMVVDLCYDADIQEHSEFDGHETEEFLRIPIGLSLLMDENLTVEEAIRLHTHAIEYDFIATAADKNIAPVGYQVTVYGTGDVVHILAENPTTGQNTYSVMTRLYMDNATQTGKLVYAHLAEYLDD